MDFVCTSPVASQWGLVRSLRRSFASGWTEPSALYGEGTDSLGNFGVLTASALYGEGADSLGNFGGLTVSALYGAKTVPFRNFGGLTASALYGAGVILLGNHFVSGSYPIFPSQNFVCFFGFLGFSGTLRGCFSTSSIYFSACSLL